ncbi:hypothetical protein MPSEU_000661800 [Mayamaea pseudoterrestris]|nr:hypothetical protein MPSEU_000661800 [Mayamaea pseudoterrestris]
MRFCPLDGTLLQVHTTSASSGATDANVFVCHTCPYRCTIKQSISFKTYTPRKQVDDILGGAAAWENVDRTAAVCPSCDCREAYFMQIQIRSADEPMSIFYKCCSCGNQWNDK